jgi:membrane associated rhomboid family serine protease
MSRLSSERARTALHLHILVNVLVYTFRNDLRPYLDLRRTYRIVDGDLRSMLLSICYHVEPAHLFVNMMALHRYGSELFANSPSRLWRSAFAVASSYVLCGIGAFAGIELLSRYHDRQWDRKLVDARHASRCTHWLCGALNDALGGDVVSSLTDAWAELSTSIQYADVRVSMHYFRFVYRIGASGVVYGWMGMRLVTSLMSPNHSRLNASDYFFLIATLAHDLRESALSLDDFRKIPLLEGDGIDHAAHVMGAISGMIWASSLILWEKLPSFRFVRWRWWGSSGGGRRLGSRWEDEQVIRERPNQRLQNSRLLNPGRGDRLRRRERTWL